MTVPFGAQEMENVSGGWFLTYGLQLYSSLENPVLQLQTDVFTLEMRMQPQNMTGTQWTTEYFK